MARPARQGLDYFPLDVDFINDRKFRNSKQKYGYLGVTVYIALLGLIYKDKGYYIGYSEKSKNDVLWDIQTALQGKFSPDIDTLGEVVDTLVADGLFSADHYSASVLTSPRIQRTYYSATVDRVGVNIDKNIWMLSVEEMKALSSKSFILRNFISRSENEINRTDNAVNQPDNTQSKVNKKKVNKSKREESIEAGTPNTPDKYPSDYTEVREYGEDGLVTMRRSEYCQLVWEYGHEKTEEYIDKMVYQMRFKGKDYHKPYAVLSKWMHDDCLPHKHTGSFWSEMAEGETVGEFIGRLTA